MVRTDASKPCAPNTAMAASRIRARVVRSDGVRDGPGSPDALDVERMFTRLTTCSIMARGNRVGECRARGREVRRDALTGPGGVHRALAPGLPAVVLAAVGLRGG